MTDRESSHGRRWNVVMVTGTGQKARRGNRLTWGHHSADRWRGWRITSGPARDVGGFWWTWLLAEKEAPSRPAA